MSEQCRDCRFYVVRSDSIGENMQGWAGYCRRYPPTFKEEPALNDGWPYVHGQSWCGEFQEAEG